jgi:hypothetical protein
MPVRADSESLPLASWFHPADRALLRFYGGHLDGKFECPPSPAGRNVDISDVHARERVRVLSAAGLLEQTQTSYQITDLGLRYVRGEMDWEELEALDPTSDE